MLQAMRKRGLWAWRFMVAEFIQDGFGRLSDCTVYNKHGAVSELLIPALKPCFFNTGVQCNAALLVRGMGPK